MNRNAFAAKAAISQNRGASSITQTRTATLSSLESSPNLRGHELVPISKISLQAEDKRTRVPVLDHALELATTISSSRLYQNLGVDTSYSIIFGGHRYVALRLLSIPFPMERYRYIQHQAGLGNLIVTPKDLAEIHDILQLEQAAAESRVRFMQLLEAIDSESSKALLKGSDEQLPAAALELKRLLDASVGKERAKLLSLLKTAKALNPIALLAQLPAKNDQVPVLVFELASDDERIAIQALENQARANYTRDQVIGIAKSLLDRGYKIGRKGRPSLEEASVPVEQRNLIPAVAQIVRLSDKSIRKMLKDLDGESTTPSPTPSNQKKLQAAVLKLRRYNSPDPEIQAWIEKGVELLARIG